MRVLAVINPISRSDVDPETYAKLFELCPDYGTAYAFGSSTGIPLDDPRTQAVFDLLRDTGLLKISRYTREYEDVDLAACQYLEIWPKASFEGHPVRDSEGRLRIVHSKLIPGLHIGYEYHSGALVVSDYGKTVLTNAGLSRISFREAAVSSSEVNPMTPHGPYWEVVTEVVLPPVSDTMCLINDNEQPFSGNPNEGCYAYEGRLEPAFLYSPPELHYRESALTSIGDFDYAISHEKFGTGGRGKSANVVSQKLRTACAAHGWAAEWRPVRIDPE